MITTLTRRVGRMEQRNGRRDGPCRCEPPLIAEIVHADRPGERFECEPARCCRCGGYGVVLEIVEEVVGPPGDAGPPVVGRRQGRQDAVFACRPAAHGV
jgi:hypothetical protein